MCHLVARGMYIRWQHLIFVLCTIVQLYKEDWGILHMHMLGCQAIALPSTEQIVGICGLYVVFKGHISFWHVHDNSMFPVT